MKHFTSPEPFYAELQAYQLKLPVLPKLLDFYVQDDQYWLKLERISGLPYLDLPSGFDATILAQTIASFHLATLANGKCLCHIDNQPKNILVSASGYYLLDFSDSRIDYPEWDISHLLLFWAADFPEAKFTILSADFINGYTKLVPLSQSFWLQCLSQSISVFDYRRQAYGKPGGKNPPQTKNANLNRLASLIL